MVKSQAKRGEHGKIDGLPRWRNGIRSGLKNLWSQGREGSIPSLGTYKYASLVDAYFVSQIGDRRAGSATALRQALKKFQKKFTERRSPKTSKYW
jgi:hypothetical protein